MESWYMAGGWKKLIEQSVSNDIFKADTFRKNLI